jgi:hypothetical protein
MNTMRALNLNASGEKLTTNFMRQHNFVVFASGGC